MLNSSFATRKVGRKKPRRVPRETNHFRALSGNNLPSLRAPITYKNAAFHAKNPEPTGQAGNLFDSKA